MSTMSYMLHISGSIICIHRLNVDLGLHMAVHGGRRSLVKICGLTRTQNLRIRTSLQLIC